VLVARLGSRLVGSVRGEVRDEDVWFLGRLMVAPDQQGRGLGSSLLAAAEASAPPATRAFRLVTGAHSVTNLPFYTHRGYREVGRGVDEGGAPFVVLEKDREPV
jgi:tRNA (guanine37-N1)-methyltransferase